MELLLLLTNEGLLNPAVLVMVVYTASRERALNAKINALRNCINHKIYADGEVVPRYVLKSECKQLEYKNSFDAAFSRIRAISERMEDYEESHQEKN